MGDIADAAQLGANNANLTAANNRLTATNAKLKGRFVFGFLLGLALGVVITYYLLTPAAPPAHPAWRAQERNLYEEP